MDISYFKEFAVLAETKNYWAAAERLFIGQSSLSKHIQTLERQLGAPLFSRTSRKVELTEFGRLMLPYAQSVSQLQYEYEAAAYNYLHVGTERLRIASIPVMARYHITDVLLGFQEAYPSVQIETQEDDTLVLREALLQHGCDLAFLRDSPDYLDHDPDKETQLVKLPFCRDNLVAVLPSGHPLAGAASLSLDQLAGENFALIKHGSMPYQLCIRACREAGFAPQVIFTSHHLDAILDMVTKGNCAALLFERHVTSPLNSVLSLVPPFSMVPIEPAISTVIYLCYLKRFPLSAAAAHFVEHCMHAKQIYSKQA